MDAPKIRDRSPVNAAMFAGEETLASERLAYLVARRDQLLDRMRFGSLALNGGSLAALLAYGGGPAAKALGLSLAAQRYAGLAFAIGMILGGISAVIDAALFRTEAGDAFARRATAARVCALYEAPATDENHEKVREEMQALHSLPLVDFQYSNGSIWTQNFAGAFWLAGTLILMAAASGFPV